MRTIMTNSTNGTVERPAIFIADIRKMTTGAVPLEHSLPVSFGKFQAVRTIRISHDL